MTGTTAVPLETLAKAGMATDSGQPMCPRCKIGFLHPYMVDIGLEVDGESWYGVDYLIGWVAVCVGNADDVDARERIYRQAKELPPAEVVHPPCGFSLPMAAKRRARPGGVL